VYKCDVDYEAINDEVTLGSRWYLIRAIKLASIFGTEIKVLQESHAVARRPHKVGIIHC